MIETRGEHRLVKLLEPFVPSVARAASDVEAASRGASTPACGFTLSANDYFNSALDQDLLNAFASIQP